VRLGLVVFAVAIAVRGAYLAEVHSLPIFDLLMGDARQYDAWARSIPREGWLGHDVFYQAPLYPYCLAIVYALVGPSLAAVRIVQAVAGAIACAALACAGRRFFSWRAGLIAGLLLAIYPPAVFYVGLLQKATLDVLLMTILLWLLARMDSQCRAMEAILAGLVVGLFALTRENTLILGLLVVGWVAIRFHQLPRRERAVRDMLVLAGIGLVLVPVGLRNQAIGGTFLPTTAQFGPNFYIGNNPQASGLYQPLRPWRGAAEYERQDAAKLAQAAMGKAMSPAEVSQYWFGKAMEFIRSHPAAWLRLFLHKVRLIWSAAEIMDTDSIEIMYEQSRLLGGLRHLLHFGVLVPLAAVGVWLTRREWTRLWVLYAATALLVVTGAAFFVFARYRFPIVPVLALFAGAGIVEMARLVRTRQPWAIAGVVLIASTTAIAANWPTDIGEQMATSHYNLGTAFRRAGRTADAVVHYRRALAIDPNHAMTLNNLAWILATDPDDRIRDGREAVALAQRVSTLTHFADPAVLDTAAAAWAEIGDFDKAIATIQSAISRIDLSSGEDEASELRAHLREFQTARPLRFAIQR
jgi:4-amino-4-deoxy-L-arabinose transferase-like glycosyltransferase